MFIYSNECLALDLEAGAWQAAASLNVARNEHGLDAVGDNLVVTGGYGDQR